MSSLPIDWLGKYLRLANYLGAAQLYLKDNFLLEEELKPEHIKDRILGHWGTVPGLNFIWASLDYLIEKYDKKVLSIIGPGHGFPAVQANLFVEGSLGEFYDKYEIVHKGKNDRKIAWGNLIKDFSWPGSGVPSHSNPATPGCILEGGELGYALSTAFGAAFDNPNLIVACVVGDGEAETGPTATAWHSNKFLNPITSGAVLPILHVNGYKISGPTIYGVMDNSDLISLFNGYGWDPILIDSEYLFEPMLAAIDSAYQKITSIQEEARTTGKINKPRWPMIILRSPKGWFGPGPLKEGYPIVGSFRSHGIPLANPKNDEKEFSLLKEWLESYKVNELINDDYSINDEILEFVPKGGKRMGMNNESRSVYSRELILPKVSEYQISIGQNGSSKASSMEKLSEYLRDIFLLNKEYSNFRIFCPDETESNKMGKVFDATNRAMIWPVKNHDEHISQDGRVMEMLSEHTLEGWLEGYLLTGRHGMIISYEAFMGIVTTMVDQYLKFISRAKEIIWRNPIPSLNIVLTSVAWRQDHNGFSHQNPGFVSSLLDTPSECVSIYYPPDANSTLEVAQEMLSSRNKVNVMVVGKRDNPIWLKPSEATAQISEDVKVWDFVSDDNPDVVLASVGDYLTREIIAARNLLKKFVPDIRLRIVNISEITGFNMGDNRFKNPSIADVVFDDIFTPDKPVILSYHGYPSDIGYLLFNHPHSARFSLHGYSEMGTTTTPFDMLVDNKVDRYNIALEAVKFASIRNHSVSLIQDKITKYLKDLIIKHKLFIRTNGMDMEDFEKEDYSI